MQTQTNNQSTDATAQATDDGTQTTDSPTQPTDTTQPSDTGCGSATTTSEPAESQSSQLDHVQHKLAAIEARLADGRVFGVLEAVRDQFGELQAQNRQIRNTVMDLQKTVFTA